MSHRSRGEIGFSQCVQRNIQKYTVGASGKSDTELNDAIKQIVSGAVSSDRVIDVLGRRN